MVSESSTVYDSIKWRLGTALLAQESVSQSVSNPLSPDQWEMESSQLFATSLARIQYDAWGIARGEDRERPGYVEVTPDEARGHLCRLYKSNSTGYTNVNLLGFICLPLAAIAIFISSLKASSTWWGAASKDGESLSSEPLIIDVVASRICSITLDILAGVLWCLVWPFRTLYRYLAGRRSKKQRVND